MKVSKDRPIVEITLRKYEKPYSLSGRELVKKLCLSLGLLQPGDSRDVIVDIFHVLLLHKKNSRHLNSEEIQKAVIGARKESNLAMAGIAASNIRRQLKRLRDLHIVEKNLNTYSITEFDSLTNIYTERIQKYILQPSSDRLCEYLSKIDNEFQK